jgi:hypothetical protein
MKTTSVALALGCWFCSACAGGAQIDLLKASSKNDGVVWKAFHERSGTKMEDVWQFREDGVLVCRGAPAGYLYVENPFDDFVLTLEWRWPPEKKPGRGGVLVRMTGEHRIWPTSLEAQINAGDAGDFWGLAGYRLDGPKDRLKTLEHEQFGKLTNLKKSEAAEKAPGEWNRYEIRVVGDVVTLAINDRVVNRASGCDVVRGRICLTAEGDEIHFRNVRLAPVERRKEQE